MNFCWLFVLIFLSSVLNVLPVFAGDTEKRVESKNIDCLTEECLANEAEGNSQYVKEADLRRFSGYLARAGRFGAAQAVVAKIQASSTQDAMLDLVNRNNAEQELVLDELASASWSNPDVIASYDKFNALTDISGNKPDNFEISSNYWLLAEKIIEKFEPTGVSIDLEKLLRPRVLRKNQNATFDELLHTRWPQAIEKVPTQKQGELWNYLAIIYTETGNIGAAAEALDRAEQRGGYDFQGNNRIFVSTTHSWLKLKNYDRALKAARQTDPKDTQALMKLQIAQELVAAGQKDHARKVLDEAAADFENYQDKGRNIGILLQIVEGYLDVDDSKDAGQQANRVLEVARLKDLFPSAQLAIAAQAYNDIGDRARAIDLLHEAVEKLPDPHKVIALGVTLGPISGATMGVGDSIRSSIVIEFYRTGSRKDFDEQFSDLPVYYKNRIWSELYSETRQRHETSPSVDEVLNALPKVEQLSFLSDLAVAAIDSGKSEEAKKFLQKALNGSGDTGASEIFVYSYIAKVAFAGGFADLTADALHKAAILANNINDKGKRITELAAVAALEHELLD